MTAVPRSAAATCSPFIFKNVHNTCYNYTCICPRMQKCILRGPNYKNLLSGARSCTPTLRSCFWLEVYPHCLLLKFCRLLRFLLKTLGQLNIWPSQKVVDDTMPQDFKSKYPNTRTNIDCTKIKCQMLSSLLLNSELFSSYKNHMTLKGSIAISPAGHTCISFISQLYTGSISVKEITEQSGFLDLPFGDNDSVIADKGFTIQDLLPVGVSLNIHHFWAVLPMSAEDVKTQNIASLRIHVERAINKIKNFHIWDGVLPLSLFGIVNQMWTVCAHLCNVQEPIVP